MGYAVVHMQKVKMNGLRGIQSHNNREHPPKTNPDIKPEQTVKNYDFIYCQNYAKRVRERIDKYATKTRTIRKDAVGYCSFVITSDEKTMKSMSNDKQKAFFMDSLKWFVNRYGAETIINATIHLDETTPHMHLGLVPIKDGRLSAKALFDKKELISIQNDFAEDVGFVYELERGLRGSERTHLSEIRFKIKQEKENEKLLLERLESLIKEKEILENSIEHYKELKVELGNNMGIEFKNLPMGFVAVKKVDFDMLCEQAKTYVVNRDELIVLNERSKIVCEMEQNVLEKEQKLDKQLNYLKEQIQLQQNRKQQLSRQESKLYQQRKKYEKLYNEQLELNKVVEELNKQIEKYQTQLSTIIQKQNSVVFEKNLKEQMKIEQENKKQLEFSKQKNLYQNSPTRIDFDR